MNLSWRRGGIVCALAVLALSWPASLRGEDRRLRGPRLRPPALAPSSAASPAFRQASSAAPSVEDATIGAVPEALKTFAASLAGPVDVFEWVRNNVRPDFYYGVMKGPVQAF